MVARKFRLREDGDIRRVRAKGSSYAHGALVLRVLPNTLEPKQNRYTVIAGKKCGGAVERNRLKRITREAIRFYHPHLAPGFDFAFICRGKVEEMPDLPTAQRTVRTILLKGKFLPKDDPAVPESGVAVTTRWKNPPAHHPDRDEPPLQKDPDA